MSDHRSSDFDKRLRRVHYKVLTSIESRLGEEDVSGLVISYNKVLAGHDSGFVIEGEVELYKLIMTNLLIC